MQLTFSFIINSLMHMLDIDFYLFSTVLCAFLFLPYLVKQIFKYD